MEIVGISYSYDVISNVHYYVYLMNLFSTLVRYYDNDSEKNSIRKCLSFIVVLCLKNLLIESEQDKL